MKYLHIECEDLEQRQDVFDVLDRMGLENLEDDAYLLSINADLIRNRYMTVVDGYVWPYSQILTHQQFMDKYSMNILKTKIDEVKAKLGLTQMQLSERIGKNPYYLDTVKHRGVTTERQLELIRELDLVANGGTVMTERAVIADLASKLECHQRRNEDLEIAANELTHKLNIAEHAYKDLDDAYGRVCEKLAEANRDVLIHKKYKHQYRDLVETVLVIGIIIILGFALWSVI